MPTVLYAWATPAFISESPVDHTWVTSYDNRVHAYPDDQAVVAAGECYWYCWGDFHAKGGIPGNASGALGQKAGYLPLAKCLVAPNADSRLVAAARGTIFTYGVDGVCHQLANQVLYATGSTRSAPLTVSAARGYWASVFVYGTYGLQHAAWAAKQSACGAGGAEAAAASPAAVARTKRGSGGPATPGGGAMRGPADEFAARAHKVLGKADPAKLAELMALRSDTQRFAAQRWPGVSAPGAEALNARNQHLIDQAAAILKPDHFRQIFGFDPGANVTLVDPKMAASGAANATPQSGPGVAGASRRRMARSVRKRKSRA